MIEYKNFDDYDEELKVLSAEIIDLVDENYNSFSPKEEKQLALCNEAMHFWILKEDVERAVWEARNTLNILRKLTEF